MRCHVEHWPVADDSECRVVRRERGLCALRTVGFWRARIHARVPASCIAAKIGVSLGIGLLVGLEREWAHKDLGVRTFGISALLGMVRSLLGTPFAVVSMVGVVVVIGYVNWRMMSVPRQVVLSAAGLLGARRRGRSGARRGVSTTLCRRPSARRWRSPRRIMASRRRSITMASR